MAVWVTHLMRSIECELARIWRQLQFPSDLKFGRLPMWLIRNSVGLIPMARRYNMFRALEVLDAAAPLLES